jgi:hypothetical protein
MTDDLLKRLNTTGAFDTPWLQEQYRNWDVAAEQRKADFTDHMYACSGRMAPGHPLQGTYTGLWQDFCMTEAGPYCRDEYYRRLEFIKELETIKAEDQEVLVS